MNIRRVMGSFWLLALAVCFTSSQTEAGSTLPIIIAVSPSTTVALGTPLTITCTSTTFAVGDSMNLAQASVSEVVLAQTRNRSTSVLNALSGRLYVSAIDVGSFVFVFNYTMVSDTGLYRCYSANASSLQLAVNVSAASASSSADTVSDNSISNGNATQNQSEGQGNSATSLARESPALYAIVLSMAALSTLITLTSIVLLMLRLRFGNNLFSMCMCQCPNNASQQDNQNQSAVDKPPSYDEVVIQSPQSPPSYETVMPPS